MNKTHGEVQKAQLIVMGSGAAGCTAALYAARMNIDVVMVTGLQKGGQLTTTTDVDNWPGDPDGVQGPDLMDRMFKQLKRFKVPVIFDQIQTVDLSNRPFRLKSDNESIYESDALIIATGASAKYLGLPSEAKFMGKGVSACATCDGFFYRGQKVAVIGGGNTAVEEALYLANIADHVVLVHRRDIFRAEGILVDKLKKTVEEGKISLALNKVVDVIVGNEDRGVNGLIIKDVKTDGCISLDVQGVFIAIGHQPNTDLFKGQLEMDEAGYIIARGGRQGGATASSLSGVFAAGDVADSIYRQAITAAGTGCMSALDAGKYLAELT